MGSQPGRSDYIISEPVKGNSELETLVESDNFSPKDILNKLGIKFESDPNYGYYVDELSSFLELDTDSWDSVSVSELLDALTNRSFKIFNLADTNVNVSLGDHIIVCASGLTKQIRVDRGAGNQINFWKRFTGNFQGIFINRSQLDSARKTTPMPADLKVSRIDFGGEVVAISPDIKIEFPYGGFLLTATIEQTINFYAALNNLSSIERTIIIKRLPKD